MRNEGKSPSFRFRRERANCWKARVPGRLAPNSRARGRASDKREIPPSGPRYRAAKMDPEKGFKQGGTAN